MESVDVHLAAGQGLRSGLFECAITNGIVGVVNMKVSVSWTQASSPVIAVLSAPYLQAVLALFHRGILKFVLSFLTFAGL